MDKAWDKVWRAYHGSEAEKQALLQRLRAHMEAGDLDPSAWDEMQADRAKATHEALFPPTYEEYEEKFGIPFTAGYLEYLIYCGLWPEYAGWDETHQCARDWPLRFMQAIEPGADLSRVVWHFLRELFAPYCRIDDPVIASLVERCAVLLDRVEAGIDVDDYVEAHSIQDEIDLVEPHLHTGRTALPAVKRVAGIVEQAGGLEWDGDYAPAGLAVSIGLTIIFLCEWAYDWHKEADLHAKIGDRLLELIAAAPKL